MIDIYYGFTKLETGDYFTFGNIKFQETNATVNYFRPKFIREILIKYFVEKGFLVCPYPTGLDLSTYERIEDLDNDWSIFKRYDFIIKDRPNDILFNLGSDYTLISKTPQPYRENIRILDNEDQLF
jgi:hypothetical protein